VSLTRSRSRVRSPPPISCCLLGQGHTFSVRALSGPVADAVVLPRMIEAQHDGRSSHFGLRASSRKLAIATWAQHAEEVHGRGGSGETVRGDGERAGRQCIARWQALRCVKL